MSPSLSPEPESFVSKRQNTYHALFARPEHLDNLMSAFSDDLVYSDYTWDLVGMNKGAFRAFCEVRGDRVPTLLLPFREITISNDFWTDRE